VEDVVDVGLGGEAVQSAGVVFVDGGLDGRDAEVLVAPDDMGSGGGDVGLGVAGDGGVAIEDEVAVGRDAGGVDLGSGDAGQEHRQDEDSPPDPMGNSGAKSLSRKNQVSLDGHGHTSVLR
jgi:hypothetical protein